MKFNDRKVIRMKRNKTIWYEHQDHSTWKPEYPECSMYRYLTETISSWPELNALVFEGKRTSFSLMIHQIEAAAKAFIGMGINPKDIVTIISPNIPQAVIAFYALNAIGAVGNMLHPLISSNEMKKAILSTDSKLILALDIVYDKIKDIKIPIVIFRVSDALPAPKNILFKALKERPISCTISWKEFLKKGENVRFAEYPGAGDDVAAIMYSGGTSGESKGVMLTNRNFNALAIQSYDTMGIVDVSGMKCLNILPIFHGTGLGITIHSMLTNGIGSVLVPRFEPEKICKLIFKEKTEFIFGVPAVYEVLSRCPEIEKKSCSFMTVLGSCGDVLPDKIRQRMNAYLDKSKAPCTLTNGYGMTECTAGCCYEPYFRKKPGTSGIMNPDNICKIVVPGTEDELPAGEIGELCIAGPIVMKGYYKDSEATAETLRVHKDGITWLHTGDAFSVDEEGYLTFHQRLDRMFIVSGFNIYPYAIEKVITAVQGIQQCCVVGKNAPVVGKKTVAYIIGNRNSMEEIKKVCSENLPDYSQPSEYIFLTEFPKTKMGKVDYKTLEEREI